MERHGHRLTFAPRVRECGRAWRVRAVCPHPQTLSLDGGRGGAEFICCPVAVRGISGDDGDGETRAAAGRRLRLAGWVSDGAGTTGSVRARTGVQDAGRPRQQDGCGSGSRSRVRQERCQSAGRPPAIPNQARQTPDQKRRRSAAQQWQFLRDDDVRRVQSEEGSSSGSAGQGSISSGIRIASPDICSFSSSRRRSASADGRAVSRRRMISRIPLESPLHRPTSSGILLRIVLR